MFLNLDAVGFKEGGWMQTNMFMINAVINIGKHFNLFSMYDKQLWHFNVWQTTINAFWCDHNLQSMIDLHFKFSEKMLPMQSFWSSSVQLFGDVTSYHILFLIARLLLVMFLLRWKWWIILLSFWSIFYFYHNNKHPIKRVSFKLHVYCNCY